MKRFISLLLTIILLVSALTIPAISFADTNYGTITDFNNEISAKQYSILKNGKITAEKKGNEWYYFFKNKGEYVSVKASAFKIKSCKISPFKKVNTELTKGVNGTKSSKSFEYIYKTSSSFSNKALLKNAYGIYKNASFTKYTVTLTDLHLYSSISSNKVTMECSLTDGCLQFVFSEMVEDRSVLSFSGPGYRQPKTAKDYLAALKRTKLNSLPEGITPKFELAIQNGGKRDLILKEYKYQNESNQIKNTSYKAVQKGIKVLKAFKSVGKVRTILSAAKSLYELADAFYELTEREDKFTLSKAYPLSCNGLYIKDAEFTSPFVLKKTGNYFQAYIYLDDAFSASKGAKLAVKFSV